MTNCLQHKGEFPETAAGECLRCGLWMDDSDESTIVRSSAPVLQTFVGHAAATACNGRTDYFAVAASLIVFGGVCAVLLASIAAPARPGFQRPSITPGAIREGNAPVEEPEKPTVMRPNRRKNDKLPVTMPASRAVVRPEPMRKRIEIIDGVEHCYAIPGGRETPC